jgi:PTH1 family peptidyl-tRNA hydrolase
MALFIKKPQTNDNKPFYTLSLSKTFLIVGLGNIGKEYNGTRHNIGFETVDHLVKNHSEFQDWQNKTNLKCHFSTGQFGENRVIVIKPTTLMNLSGQTAKLVTDFYKIPASSVVVIHDELDIDFGQIRARLGGNSAGHNGIKSVINAIGDNFGRIRIGIGPKKPEQIDSADFVLAKFSKDELTNINTLCSEVDAMVIEYIYSGKLNEETRSFLV